MTVFEGPGVTEGHFILASFRNLADFNKKSPLMQNL